MKTQRLQSMLKSLSGNPRRQVVAGLCAVFVIFLFIALIKFFQIRSAMQAHASMQQPPEAVNSVLVQEENWDDEIRAVATLSASQGAVLSAEEPGKIVKIGFESGGSVQTGDFLLEIDASVEDAQLKGASATTRRARASLERATKLRQDLAMSQDALELAQETLAKAESAELALKAVIARKKIHAPFSGLLGVRAVSIGQYVTVGAPLVPLFALDPIYVDFALPQANLQVLKPGLKVSIGVDAIPDRVFTGTLSTVDPQVDPVTRLINVRATLANPDASLRPGMFARATITQESKRAVISVPQSAIMHAPYGDSVWVIKPGNAQAPRAIEQQIVRLGEHRGDKVAVLSGLKPGDEVASTGVFKLRPGVQVVINNSIGPSYSLNPQPEDT